MMITNDTMVVQLTVGQLCGIIDDRVRNAMAVKEDPDPRGELVHGIKALAEFLGLSISTTSAIINEGRYKEAIVRREGSRRVSFFPKVLKRLLQEESLKTL